MKKTQRKDAVRNIKKRIVSYLSICLVIMFGLGGALITSYMSAGINAEATDYYNAHNFKDFELLSSLGVNDADIDQIKETEGVIDAEGVIRTSGSLSKDSFNTGVEIISMTERISVPEVVEGQAPAAKDECLIGEDFAEIKGISVGDRVKIVLSGGDSSAKIPDDEDEDGEEKDESTLLESEFTVTGLMKHPDYLRRKSTNTVALPWAAFNTEYLGDMQYSHVFIRTEEPEGVNIFSDKYFEKTAGTKLALEELAETLEVDSLERTKKRVNDDLDREWQAALDELDDAQQEIDDNEAAMETELDKALGDLNDAQEELDSKVSAANKKIKEGEEEIRKGESGIKAGEAEIKEGEKEIKEGEKEIRAYEKKIEAAEKRIKTSEEKLKASEKELKEYKEQLKQIDDNLPEAKEYIRKLREDYEEQLETKLETLAEMRKLLNALNELDIDSEEYNETALKLAEFIYTHEEDMKKNRDFCSKDEEMEVAEKIRDLTGIDGTDTIAALRDFDVESLCSNARAIYEHGGDISGFIKETEDYIKLIEDELETIKKYEDYIKEYEKNRADLYKQISDYEKQLADAKEKIAAAKKQVAAAKEKLAEAKKQLAAAKKKIAAAKKKLAAAKRKLAAGKKRLAASKSELESEKAKYRAQIRDGWNMYYAKKAEYEAKLEEAKALLAENREEAEKKFDELKAEVDSLECTWLVLDRRANAGYLDIKSNISSTNTSSAIFGALFMLISAIVCLSTLTIIIEEQKKMVGTVKAFGFRKREILGKYLTFGASAAAAGCIAGVTLALGLSGFALKAYKDTGMYPFESIKTVVTPGKTVMLCALMIGICAIATVVACSDILRSPASILMKGGKSGKNSGYRKKSSKRSGSLYSKLIIRNMLDDKVRVTISIVIIAFSTLLVGTGISMKLAFDGMREIQLSDVYNYDVRVDLGETAGDEDRSAVEKVLSGQGTEYIPASYEAHVFRLDDRLDMIYVLTADPEELNDYFAVSDIRTGEPLELPDDGVLAQKKMKESYGLGKGSTLSIFSSDLSGECEAEIKGEFQNYVGRVIITSPEGYRSIFGESAVDNCYYVKLCGADLETLKSSLLAADEDISIESADNFVSKFQAVSFLYNLIVYVTTGIAILMSFMILSNLANIYLNRKKTELTVMRINGFSIKQTKGYLSRETIVTTAAGVILGVLCGAAATPLIIRAMEQPDLQFVRPFHVLAWAIAVVLEVIFSIVINSIVFRKVKDLDFRDVA